MEREAPHKAPNTLSDEVLFEFEVYVSSNMLRYSVYELAPPISSMQDASMQAFVDSIPTLVDSIYYPTMYFTAAIAEERTHSCKFTGTLWLVVL